MVYYTLQYLRLISLLPQPFKILYKHCFTSVYLEIGLESSLLH